jgi:hypothetical protein
MFWAFFFFFLKIINCKCKIYFGIEQYTVDCHVRMVGTGTVYWQYSGHRCLLQVYRDSTNLLKKGLKSQVDYMEKVMINIL